MRGVTRQYHEDFLAGGVKCLLFSIPVWDHEATWLTCFNNRWPTPMSKCGKKKIGHNHTQSINNGFIEHIWKIHENSINGLAAMKSGRFLPGFLNFQASVKTWPVNCRRWGSESTGWGGGHVGDIPVAKSMAIWCEMVQFLLQVKQDKSSRM